MEILAAHRPRRKTRGFLQKSRNEWQQLWNAAIVRYYMFLKRSKHGKPKNLLFMGTKFFDFDAFIPWNFLSCDNNHYDVIRTERVCILQVGVRNVSSRIFLSGRTNHFKPGVMLPPSGSLARITLWSRWWRQTQPSRWSHQVSGWSRESWIHRPKRC